MKWFDGASPALRAEVASAVQTLIDDPSLLGTSGKPSAAKIDQAVSSALSGARERMRWRKINSAVRASCAMRASLPDRSGGGSSGEMWLPPAEGRMPAPPQEEPQPPQPPPSSKLKGVRLALFLAGLGQEEQAEAPPPPKPSLLPSLKSAQRRARGALYMAGVGSDAKARADAAEAEAEAKERAVDKARAEAQRAEEAMNMALYREKEKEARAEWEAARYAKRRGKTHGAAAEVAPLLAGATIAGRPATPALQDRMPLGAAATGFRQPPPPPVVAAPTTGPEGVLLSQLAEAVDDATEALPGAVSASLPGALAAMRALRGRVREAQQALVVRAQKGAPPLDPRALGRASSLFEDALVALDDLCDVGGGANPVLILGAISAAQRSTDALLAAVMGGGGGGGGGGAYGACGPYDAAGGRVRAVYNAPGAPPMGARGGYGAAPAYGAAAQGGYGAAPASGGYRAAPAPGGYGRPSPGGGAASHRAPPRLPHRAPPRPAW